MTISNEEENRQEEELLKTLTVLLADKAFFGIQPFSESHYPYVLPTTWRALYSNEFLEHSKERGTDHFYLIGKGWKRALKLIGKFDDPEFVSRLSRICAAAKKHVKGRHDDDLVYAKEFATEADVSLGWLMNVITANVIEETFSHVGLSWAKGLYIVIPINFGMKLS